MKRALLIGAILLVGLAVAFNSVRAGEEVKKVANAVGGGYIAYPNTLGTAVFSHYSHANAGFACTDCHPGTFPYKKGSFTMKDLYAGKACGKCHDGKMTAPKHPELIAPAVSNCMACHAPKKDIVYTGKGPGTVTFKHSTHTALVVPGEKEGEQKVQVDAGYSCGDCHTKLFARKANQLKMDVPHTTGCATCHNGKSVSPSGKTAPASTNCATCHKA